MSMEAKASKRAVLRLIVAALGVVMTVGMLAETAARLAGWRDPGPTAACPPVWGGIAEAVPHGAFVYAAPLEGTVASGEQRGPLMIYNPAAAEPPAPSRPAANEVGRVVRRGASAGDRAPAPPASDPPSGEPAPRVAAAPAPPFVRPKGTPQAPRQGVVHPALRAYTASNKDLSGRLAEDVRGAFALGRSGAVYAARTRFLVVLREVATAQDAAEGDSRHARALADGLRALDEADDFLPRGDVLESELDVPAIAASHSTPVVREASVEFSPHDAVALYSKHAAEKLAEAASGEPVASMALHGLGKCYARLAAQGEDPLAERKCLVMYDAAVTTRPDNYLAANELGVHLARAGRYDQASLALRSAARGAGASSVVYTNLAEVERKRGEERLARSAEVVGQRVAARDYATGAVSRSMGVVWVDPATMRGATQPTAPQGQPQAAAPLPPGAVWPTPAGAALAAPMAAPMAATAQPATRAAAGWGAPAAQGDWRAASYRGGAAPPQRVLR